MSISEDIRSYAAELGAEIDDALVKRMSECELRLFPSRVESIASERTVWGDRFALVGAIGRGGQGTTYLAWDLEFENWIVVKELEFERLDDWKGIELFEREAAALQAIDHPQIPKYIDAQTIEDGAVVRFMIAQSFVDGEDLNSVAKRERWTETDATTFLDSFSDILNYLHDRPTPIVHRDIKPSNIIIDRDGVPHLVDFGAVQIAIPKTMGGSTVIGTSGFVPLEQYMGRATAKSDIYATAATVARMISGVEPVDMDVERGRLKIEKYIDVSPTFRTALNAMLEPIDEDRIHSWGATKALRSTALVKRPQTRVIPIPTKSSTYVKFEDPNHKWVDIESRYDGQQLDRYVRAFPKELRLIVSAKELRVQRETTPFALGVAIAFGLVVSVGFAAISSYLAWVGILLLVFYVATVHLRRDGFRIHRSTEDSPRLEISGKSYPLSVVKEVRPTKSGIAVEVSDITFKMRLHLDMHQHEYFAKRIQDGLDRIRIGESLDPLDIW